LKKQEKNNTGGQILGPVLFRNAASRTHTGKASARAARAPPGISHPSCIERNENKVKICCSIFA
jgi:hypothetical protein